MKRFIKENTTLALGLGMPLLLVGVFALAAWLPSLTAEPPKYDVVFTAGCCQYNGINITVVNGKLRAATTGLAQYGYQRVRLYIYHPASDSLREISIALPAEAVIKSGEARPEGNKIIPIPVPEMDNVKLDDSAVSPDGYQFSTDAGSANGLFTDFLFPRYNHGVALRKGGYRHRIPDYGNSPYYGQAEFIGWVMPQQ